MNFSLSHPACTTTLASSIFGLLQCHFHIWYTEVKWQGHQCPMIVHVFYHALYENVYQFLYVLFVLLIFIYIDGCVACFIGFFFSCKAFQVSESALLIPYYYYYHHLVSMCGDSIAGQGELQLSPCVEMVRIVSMCRDGVAGHGELNCPLVCRRH